MSKQRCKVNLEGADPCQMCSFGMCIEVARWRIVPFGKWERIAARLACDAHALDVRRAFLAPINFGGRASGARIEMFVAHPNGSGSHPIPDPLPGGRRLEEGSIGVSLGPISKVRRHPADGKSGRSGGEE
jgi:hypothetical protein